MAKQLSEMTNLELATRKKEMTVAVILILFCIVIMLISAVYTYTKKGFTATAVLPFAFFPIAIINLMNLKKIRAELGSRKK